MATPTTETRRVQANGIDFAYLEAGRSSPSRITRAPPTAPRSAGWRCSRAAAPSCTWSAPPEVNRLILDHIGPAR
jgi:hypothetical protein